MEGMELQPLEAGGAVNDAAAGTQAREADMEWDAIVALVDRPSGLDVSHGGLMTGTAAAVVSRGRPGMPPPQPDIVLVSPSQPERGKIAAGHPKPAAQRMPEAAAKTQRPQQPQRPVAPLATAEGTSAIAVTTTPVVRAEKPRTWRQRDVAVRHVGGTMGLSVNLGPCCEMTGCHYVSRLLENGPAANAGVRVGDRLLAAGGQALRGKSWVAVLDALRGGSVLLGSDSSLTLTVVAEADLDRLCVDTKTPLAAISASPRMLPAFTVHVAPPAPATTVATGYSSTDVTPNVFFDEEHEKRIDSPEMPLARGISTTSLHAGSRGPSPPGTVETPLQRSDEPGSPLQQRLLVPQHGGSSRRRRTSSPNLSAELNGDANGGLIIQHHYPRRTSDPLVTVIHDDKRHAMEVVDAIRGRSSSPFGQHYSRPGSRSASLSPSHSSGLLHHRSPSPMRSNRVVPM